MHKLVGVPQALCAVLVCVNAGLIASVWACPSVKRSTFGAHEGYVGTGGHVPDLV